MNINNPANPLKKKTEESFSVPPGGIIIWSGASNAIPEGWALCDGKNGTPNLMGKFILGYGYDRDFNTKLHDVGETGGSEEVTLTETQMPKHMHSIGARASSTAGHMGIGFMSGMDTPTTGGYTENTGASQPHPNMPPYYVLCYIMKL